MKTHKVLLASTAVCGLVLFGSAQAQQSQQQSPQQMQNMMQQMQRQAQQQQQQGQQGQGELSQREVRSFFQQVQQTISQAVQNNNPSAIRQWTQNALADDATIMTMVEVYGENGAREFRTTQLEKQDILRRQQAMMSVAPELLSLIQDYNLNIRIQNVQPIAQGVAIVKTRVTESGVLGGGRGGQQMSSGLGQQSFQQSGSDQSAQQGAGGGQQGFGSRWSQMQQRQQQQGQGGQGQLTFNGNADCTHLVQRSENTGNLQIGMTTCAGEMSF